MAVDDPKITREDADALALHVALCPECEKAFYRMVGMNEDGSFTANSEARLAQQPPPTMTVAEGWQDLLQRCPDLAQAYRSDMRRQSIRRVFRRAGQVAAMAACLALLLVGGWLLVARSQSTAPAAPDAYAEFVKGTERQTMALGQPVRTQAQRQEIWLSGMHRVVMNQNTSATFTADRHGTYQIRLTQGELYVEVVPGHPFTVRTDNALLNITGTQFDVKAEPRKTELMLLKGSVRLSSLGSAQAVDVMAGCASMVAGQAPPTIPVAIDAIAATAWARDLSLANAVARVAPQLDDGVLATVRDAWRQPDPPDLDQPDYIAWRDTHREWFMQQFPWIFKAKAVMQKEWGIQADYIELLMVSADLWQFHYDPKLPVDQPLAKLEPMTLARLARHYRIEERQLLRSVGLQHWTPEISALAASPVPNREHIDALRRWQDALTVMTRQASERAGDATLFALRASMYLSNTRTAAYLWTRAHPQEARQLLSEPAYAAGIPTIQVRPTVLEEQAWVGELRRQAALARSSNRIAHELLMTPPTSECVSQTAGQQRKLASLLAELLPQADQSLGEKSDN